MTSSWSKLMAALFAYKIAPKFAGGFSLLAISISHDGINLLAPGRYVSNFKGMVFELIIQNCSWGTRFENCPRRLMPQNFSNDKSTLVQVMDWCRQATSHCMSQCWPKCMTPYGVSRPVWVKLVTARLQHKIKCLMIYQYLLRNS